VGGARLRLNSSAPLVKGDTVRVVVAGGGIAALETLAGLHVLAGDRVETTLLAPDRSFAYRPLSMATPFALLDERSRPLDELARGVGATFVRHRLAQVDHARRRVLTDDGSFLDYDALVVAVGPHPARGPQDLVWRRGPDATRRFAHILGDLERGDVRSLVVVVPPRAAWPVDAYELALVASLAAARAGSGARVSLITAERAPLEAFGDTASEAVTAELARAGIELVAGVDARRAERREVVDGDAFSSMIARMGRRRGLRGEQGGVELRLGGRESVTVDRALFLPAAQGPAIPGMPCDAHGFIPVDAHGRAGGEEGLFAAGDATPLVLKHSSLAAAQGAAAAEAIAATAGAEIDPRPWSPILYGLLTVPPHFGGARGSPWVRPGEPITHCLWWPPGHAAGRHLAPYLAATDPRVRPGLEWHPNGIPIAVSLAGATGVATTASSPDPALVRRDAMERQLLAIRRAEREGETLERALEARGRDFERHERDVVQRLRAAGYLQGGA
jgi:sulfide:quinone oxidoreductase